MKCHVRLSKVPQCRLAAQQQPQGTPVTGSENDTYDMAEERMTPDATTMQKSRSETSKIQMTLNRLTTSAAILRCKQYQKWVERIADSLKNG
uniref:Uncharacterized protein n=1 Tax=Romanomermis culicivorax TaxID=13658 RepID=A0A915HUE9_ROMCU